MDFDWAVVSVKDGTNAPIYRKPSAAIRKILEISAISMPINELGGILRVVRTVYEERMEASALKMKAKGEVKGGPDDF